MGWREFSGHTRFEVGDDSKIWFWHDVWCMDLAHKVAFLKLFSMARFKDASMADHLEFSSDTISGMLILSVQCMTRRWISWPHSLICCTPSDWEAGCGQALLGPFRGLFDVKSFYIVLIPHDSTPFPLSIWRIKVPIRVAFFGWLAAFEKIIALPRSTKPFSHVHITIATFPRELV